VIIEIDGPTKSVIICAMENIIRCFRDEGIDDNEEYIALAQIGDGMVLEIKAKARKLQQC